MFKKILIANRGEIACRVMRTAKRLGIRTVAVHSDADVSARHVAIADEAYHLGPSPAVESYLSISSIIDACLASGAEAVHPGYGFLSENPEFVEAIEAAGVTFIGPSAEAIRAMGLKDAAKALMERAEVPVVPGYHGDRQDPDFLAGQAEEIGYPIMIKARAGGGGKGMRRVDRRDAFREALESAAREAEASFGDGRCLLEKYLTKPRHIEIQLFGDDHGNVVHLFERDCSLQRRHQKVIEEAPAPGMTDAMRTTMGEAAVRAARAISYSGAGTVEFIADVSDGLRADRFYFMEMNTRLQVEHPVTEMITGLDLVEWQLRVAAGEPLPLAQSDLSIDGWAFEARVYAENAGQGFLPATGRLAHLSFPDGIARVDTGVRQGDEITSYYDPMIAKLITHGPSREAALGKLSAALAASRIAGSTTNIAFLSALAAHPGFARGAVDTGLIERDLDGLTTVPPPPAEAWAMAALTVLGFVGRNEIQSSEPGDPWSDLVGWRLWFEAMQTVVMLHDGKPTGVDVIMRGAKSHKVVTPAGTIEIEGLSTDGVEACGHIDGRTVRAATVRLGETVTVFLNGNTFEWTVPDPLEQVTADAAGDDRLVAPIPGLVKMVAASPGDHVAKEAPLIVMEAMKMEHMLKAPRDGIVDDVLVDVGDRVEEGAVLLELAASSD
ncbi:MAG: acetyl/propionyl/methylcrotonyl-CoA carboxylase subunit alpha [Geminicoccaceae bacterium]